MRSRACSKTKSEENAKSPPPRTGKKKYDTVRKTGKNATVQRRSYSSFTYYKYPPAVNIPQTSTLTTLPKAMPAESMVPRNAPSSLFFAASRSSSLEPFDGAGGFSISISSFSKTSSSDPSRGVERRLGEEDGESVCGPSAMQHAALKPFVNPKKKMSKSGNASKERTRGTRQPDRSTLHEASKGTNTILYRLRRNAT